MSMVSIREGRDVTQTHFETDKDAIDKYLELTKTDSQPLIIPVKADKKKQDEASKLYSDDDVIKYVKDNISKKGVKSARHLNRVFKADKSKKFYDNLLMDL